MNLNNFGKILREERKIHDLKQKDLAKILNLSRATISNYESGKTIPDAETLQKIIKHFNLNFDDTYFLTPYEIEFIKGLRKNTKLYQELLSNPSQIEKLNDLRVIHILNK